MKRFGKTISELMEINEAIDLNAFRGFRHVWLEDWRKNLRSPLSGGECRTVTYIIQGMREGAVERNSRLKFGGANENPQGYRHSSLKTVKRSIYKIGKATQDFTGVLILHSKLSLGGDIVPWVDAEYEQEG